MTDELKNKEFPLTLYPHIGPPVIWRNNHKLLELYGFDRFQIEQRCLWFISSRIFNLRVNENGGFDGILFTSDNDKDKKLYTLDSSEIIQMFEIVGNNDMTRLEWKRCPETGKEETQTW